MEFRLATLSDLDLLADWRWELSSWLGKKGTDQWDNTGLSRDEFQRRITRSIEAGETWIAMEHGKPVGTIAIDLVPDQGLWSDSELEDSYIIHRMMVPRFAAGRNIGRRLVDFASEIAKADGRSKLVLDAWSSNRQLHHYYESLGFEKVRQVDGHWTPSATLFEKNISGVNTQNKTARRVVHFKDEGR